MNAAPTWILSHRWAILPSALQTIYEIASRESAYSEAIREAVAAKDAAPLANTRRAEVRDGIAIIGVTGPIFPRANLFTSISGATSVQVLAKDFTVAVEDPNVRGIVLNIDSPGGEVTGINETASMIRAARSQKPITAYVNGYAASAAYWLASAAGRIVVDATAEVGSIGVVAGYQDTTVADEKRGVKNIEIVSSVSPNKRPDLQSDAGRAQVQRIVDDLAAVFVSTVADNRGVSVARVVKDFGGGGLFVGEHAVTAGLADSVGSFEGVLASMRSTIDTLARFGK